MWACGFSSFHQNMNQCLDFSTIFSMFSLKPIIKKRERGEDVESMAEVWILCNVCDLGIKA